MSVTPMFDNFFENFTTSLAASRKLLQKAHEQGNLIEGLILYTSIIDALLRNLIAHSTAVPKSTYKYKARFLFDDLVLNEALFQHDDAHWLDERDIYKMALKNKIINPEDFEQLNQLFTFRNRVVHRFIISDIAYGDIRPVLIEYERYYQRFIDQLSAIEQPDAVVPEEGEVFKAILRKIDRKF